MIPGLFSLIMYLQQEPKHKSVPGSPINNTTSGFFFQICEVYCQVDLLLNCSPYGVQTLVNTAHPLLINASCADLPRAAFPDLSNNRWHHRGLTSPSSTRNVTPQQCVSNSRESLADHDVMVEKTCYRLEAGPKHVELAPLSAHPRGPLSILLFLVSLSLSLSPSTSPPAPPPPFCSTALSVYECMNRSISLYPTPSPLPIPQLCL